MFADAFDGFFLSLLNTGFAASAAILVVLLLRLLLRRAPKRYSYLLWAPVLLRLLCPFSLESVFSLLPADPTPIPENIAQMAQPQLDTGFVPLNEAVNSILPAARVGDSVNPMQLLLAAGQLIWLAGAAGLLLYAAISTLRLRRRLKNAVCEGKNIYIVPGLATPFVMGVFRPRIYLPADLGDGEKGYILLHERTHLRRGDHLVRLAAFFAVCLHWFNPLVWLAYHLSGQDMEMSCDEAVVSKMGASVKRPYSASLLALASGQRWVGGTPLAFGEGDTSSRIKNVLRCRRPAVWAGVLLAVLVTVCCVGLALNPKEEDASGSDSSQVQEGSEPQQVSLEQFTVLARDLEGPGDHGIQIALEESRDDALALLQEEKWRTPQAGELPEIGFSAVMTLLSEDGQTLSVCSWDQERTLIMLGSVWDDAKKTVYIAPGEVSQDAQAFSDAFLESHIEEEDWVRMALSSVSASTQKISLVIPAGLAPERVFSVEISALIPRKERETTAYTERVVMLEEQKTGAEWPAGTVCEGEFPYEECPDGTKMSVNVQVLAQEGDNWIVSSWGYRSYLCEEGQLTEQVIPANTAVTISKEESSGETRMTLEYGETTGEGFAVTFTLPQGWTAGNWEEAPLEAVGIYGGNGLQKASDKLYIQPGKDSRFLLYAGVDIFSPDSEQPVGWIGYDLLEQGQPPAEENRVYYYNSLMLGSAVNWNNEYREVLHEGSMVSATCLAGINEGGAGGQISYDWGILARDEELGRFIAIRIAQDALDQDTLEQIVRSIRFESRNG